ncbi:MAG TPA: GAF domain-containing protein [Candidatus Hydrogenedentes bacterium]|nr:GAF domain-containing protein [Candidatus Hydrogenedentota bacterium]
MSMTDFPCPSCGHILKISVKHIGKKGKCSFCNAHILITAAAFHHAENRNQVNALEALAQLPRSLEELISNALDFLARFIGCNPEGKAILFLMDHSAGGIRLIKTRGQFSQDFLDDEAFVPLGKCLCGRAAQSGQVLVCEDCFTDSRHDTQWLGMQTHGHYVIPLKHQGQVIAVLDLYTKTGVKVDNKQTALLAKVGEYAGTGLHHFLCREKEGSLI